MERSQAGHNQQQIKIFMKKLLIAAFISSALLAGISVSLITDVYADTGFSEFNFEASPSDDIQVKSIKFPGLNQEQPATGVKLINNNDTGNEPTQALGAYTFSKPSESSNTSSSQIIIDINGPGAESVQVQPGQITYADPADISGDVIYIDVSPQTPSPDYSASTPVVKPEPQLQTPTPSSSQTPIIEPESASQTSQAPAPAQKSALDDMREKASLLARNNVEVVLGEIQETRDAAKEGYVGQKYIKSLIEKATLANEQAGRAINVFITYGVDDNTKKLGAGERAAVMHSYQSVFKKLPETEEEFLDAIKIANGRWPSKTSEPAEHRAQENFRTIYKRNADMDNPHDNAAVTIMAYGLRQRAENRNLNSEQQGIKTFKAIYGATPATSEDWNIMQAITYSGATR